jgi:hypothetical protein
MNKSNRQRRLSVHKSRGKEIFEITPIILGGSPADPTNKVLLSREEHIKAVAYWNRIIKENSGGKGQDSHAEP